VLRATVPETPIHEDSQACGGENEVRPPEQGPPVPTPAPTADCMLSAGCVKSDKVTKRCEGEGCSNAKPT
jgi:hypothetical protein